MRFRPVGRGSTVVRASLVRRLRARRGWGDEYEDPDADGDENAYAHRHEHSSDDDANADYVR